MGRKNFKPIYLDYSIWSETNDTEKRCYQLTDRQVMALQAFTEFLEWSTRWDNAENFDKSLMIEWRAELENALQLDEECGGMFDCSQLDDCLPSNSEIISIKKSIATQQITIDVINGNEAVAAYEAAGNDIQVYNPSVPDNFSSDPATLQTLCIVAFAFIEELARKLNNYSALMLDVGNIVTGFASLIPGLSESIPAWLSAINNYLLNPIGLSLPDYTEMQEIVNDSNVLQVIACELKEVMNNNPVSYAGYLSYISSIPANALYPEYDIMRQYVQTYCANEQAYLYFCDLLGKATIEGTGDYDCVCGSAVVPASWSWSYVLNACTYNLPTSWTLNIITGLCGDGPGTFDGLYRANSGNANLLVDIENTASKIKKITISATRNTTSANISQRMIVTVGTYSETVTLPATGWNTYEFYPDVSGTVSFDLRHADTKSPINCVVGIRSLIIEYETFI